MKVVETEKKVYEVGDKVFLDRIEAESYIHLVEAYLKHSYFVVRHNPELTQSGVFQSVTLVGVTDAYVPNAVIEYCIANFGSPIVKVQGVSPTNNWVISSPQRFKNVTDLKKFLFETKNTELSKEQDVDLVLIDGEGRIQINKYRSL